MTTPWWIAGGWALSLFRGSSIRAHGDLDIGVLRRDTEAALQAISTWEVFEAKDGRLTQLSAGEPPSPGVHSLWCRPSAMDPWTIELMIDEADDNTWIYRRDPRVRRSLDAVVRQSTDGLQYLAPEIQLLYKSKDRRQRDDADFAAIGPLLPMDARRWLHDVLELVAPQPAWIAALE
jgi:hypothetical protein